MRQYVILIIVCIIWIGCHKKNSSPNLSYILSYDPCDYAGTSIAFSCSVEDHSNPPYVYSKVPSAAATWDFGDGTATTVDNYPSHVYNNAGIYTVTMVVDGHSVKRDISIAAAAPVSTYTARMDGARKWIGQGSGLDLEVPTTGGGVDTELTIKVLNPGTIQFPFYDPAIPGYTPTSTLVLMTIDTMNKKLVFSPCSNSNVILTYYYDKDSITYTDIWYAKVGHGYEDLEIHTQ